MMISRGANLPFSSSGFDEEHLTVLIATDGTSRAEQLDRQLKGVMDVSVVGMAHHGTATMLEAERLRPDLIVFDAGEQDKDGLPFASAVNEADAPGLIVIAGSDRLAVQAFEAAAVDYLVRPVCRDRLRTAIDRARARRREKEARRRQLREANGLCDEPVLHVPDRHGGRDVCLRDIVWIEAQRDYALIHEARRTHILRQTMAQLARISPHEIIRVHRSTLVSLAHVRRWKLPVKGLHGLQLSNGSEVIVGPTYVQQTRAALLFLCRYSPKA